MADRSAGGVGLPPPGDQPPGGQAPGVTITEEVDSRDGHILTVNFGPQHPSTHGVLRLIVDLDGEEVRAVKPVIGYLHTGIEKQMEALRWQQGVTVTDRHDYLSPPINNLAYALAVEQLMGVEAPPRAQGLRIIMSELTRLASHLVWLATSALELGPQGPFMYAFRERDSILDMNEEISGYRMHTSYIRPGGVLADATPRFFDMVNDFIEKMPGHVDEYEELLTYNPIWVRRLRGIGPLSAEDAIRLGATGPMLRGSGVAWDLRKDRPYSGYEKYDFDVVTSDLCDCYGRYLIRIGEMRQSVRILRQAIDNLPGGPFNVDDRKMLPPPREELETSMEAVIHHFKLFTEGYSPPAGDVYVAVESGRGENGCYIVSDGTHKPRRVKFRSTSFVHLQALEHLSVGQLVADLIAIIGTADTILGDVDR
ncbi:MAG: NADH-quinone oxidoreductase subunit D [Candidatus Dormibacteraeota bacterium]|nr:NADH-quinone oxidoreductase subunit D [Candidatus Dormibacteraeota bacterium]MBO0704023.1 NADH-quinone oxidoreductase subunit D [Candidatus Dormibacteraeota bacterium]MBO0761523.1 NADH-quinone oxidoreductase subunit D [Candidatus Dormibacteraeota bacterium]